jgi:hypothetical protein
MSTLGHKQTLANSFNQLIGDRQLQAERFDRGEID